MARKEERSPRAHVLEAALIAQHKQAEKDGISRERLKAGLRDSDRITVEKAEQDFGRRMRKAGRPGW